MEAHYKAWHDAVIAPIAREKMTREEVKWGKEEWKRTKEEDELAHSRDLAIQAKEEEHPRPLAKDRVEVIGKDGKVERYERNGEEPVEIDDAGRLVESKWKPASDRFVAPPAALPRMVSGNRRRRF
jgi:hypothetical protein